LNKASISISVVNKINQSHSLQWFHGTGIVALGISVFCFLSVTLASPCQNNYAPEGWKERMFVFVLPSTPATLGVLNAESFCERVLSCVKLVVSDLHVSLKADEIRMLVMLRMNREFMEY
jgi:hypothetical protein